MSCCRPHCDSEKNGAERTSLFVKYLLATNTISSVFFLSVGDLIQQEVEYVLYGKHKNSFDWKRTCNMGSVGFVLGPITHYFYRMLDKSLPGTESMVVAKKICLDQTLASPTAICIFILLVNYFNGESYENSKAELKKKFLSIYIGDCLIWIPAQIINFYWLSPRFRVIYVNIVTMCYNVYLSYMKYELT